MQRYHFIALFFLILNISSYAMDKRGIFIWPATFCELGGIENVMDILKQNKFSDIFLLVKGEEGFTFFPSDYNIKDYYKLLFQKSSDEKEKKKYSDLHDFMSDSTLLGKIIEQAHQNNIKVHAWFIVSGDRNYVRNNPGSEVVSIQKPEITKYLLPSTDKGNINLAYSQYKKHLLTLIEKALEYPFDGLMLDKIRYTNLLYTWDEIHLSKAIRLGVDVNKVIDCAIRTAYGTEEEKESFIYKYRDGDNDIREWIKIKKDDIEDYIKEAYKITKDKNITLSASFMPEGAYDEDFGDVYYAQNYKELSPYFDFIVIMAYINSYNQPAAWLKMVAANALEKSSCKIWAGIQGFDNIDSKLIFEQVINARMVNSDGIAVFRLGGMTSGMWNEFQKGMEFKVDKHIKSHKKGIVYVGKGTIRNSWIKSTDALLKSDNIIPLLLKEDLLSDLNIFKEKRFILIPGGGGAAEAEALGITSLNNIEKFVASGGGYVGICAGSYLPVKGYNEFTEKLQIVNAAPKDVLHWNRGSGKVQLEIVKNHPIFSDIQGNNFELNYFSGPLLESSNLQLPAYRDLAVFKTDYHKNGATAGDMFNKTAILEANYQLGKIILFSPHPELTPGQEKLLINAINYVSGQK